MDTGESPNYQLLIRDIAPGERPRERMVQVGARALSTAELLAIVLRTGTGGLSVIRLAEGLLASFKGLKGLGQASIAELTTARVSSPVINDPASAAPAPRVI